MHSSVSYPEVIEIGFPSYNRDELSQILYINARVHERIFNNIPERFEPERENLLKDFINIIAGTFFNSCIDYYELLHLVFLLFPRYIKPLQKPETEHMNEEQLSNKLYQKISPKLQKLLKNVSFSNITLSDLVESPNTNIFQNANIKELWKYVLFAGFIASHNEKKYDKYILGTGRENAMRRRIKKTPKIKVRKPKSFIRERLFAILYSIYDSTIYEDGEVTEEKILRQLEPLCSLKFIEKRKNSYMCVASFEVVKDIAKTINFEIESYLYTSDE
eukprot:TRINITY_DN1257_c0_g1_i2.p1 TRINITY_DN1257_c0_g1~~TRINITY_DN1257_c0_g1_i2.p1  ORF type:complete len:275 (+),score=52.62 TRINITY_DN1257_c0_g1_i2:515-1339(+)